MPTAIVLDLGDSSAGPALELMRRVCQPRSRSKPHITVRHPVDRLKDRLELYEETTVDSVILQTAAAFDLPEDPEYDDLVKRATVFVLCRSDELEALAYKPDFPDSVFHVTVYDGTDIAFARSVLSVLETCSWPLRSSFPAPKQLEHIPIGVSKRGMAPKPWMSLAAMDLLGRIAPEIPAADLHRLPQQDRLSLLTRLVRDLEDTQQHVSASQANATDQVLTAPEKATQLSLPIISNEAGASREPGLFITPPEIAAELAELAVAAHEAPSIHFGDPALGSGVLFGAVLREAGNRLRSAVGVEVDARRSFATATRWGHRGLQVVNEDFLDMDLQPTRSLVIANPPWIRYQELDRRRSRSWSASIADDLDISIDGQAGLFVYFLLRAQGWMKEGAVGVWLLPSEFMQTKYGDAVRRYLTTNVTLLRLHLLGHGGTSFENARASATIVAFRNQPPTPDAEVCISWGGMPSRPSGRRTIALSSMATESKWAGLAARTWVSRLHSETNPLGTFFDVRRGIATGANSWFVLPDEVVRRHSIPSMYLKPLLPRPRTLNEHVIEADEFGTPIVSELRWLIDTSSSLAQIEENSRFLAAHLRAAEREIGGRTLVRSRRPFYRQEQRDPPPFVCTYMGSTAKGGRGIRFFRNRSKAVALNNYLLLYPKPELLRALRDDHAFDGAVLDALRAVEAAQIDYFGRAYADGLQKIEPRELERVPFPLDVSRAAP